ncbi:MAG: hypothetical protein U1F10_12625 [Burkholderiales bacterium]
MMLTRYVPRLVVLAFAFTAVPALAQEACKMTQVAKPLALADMVKMATERAKAWKPDARLASMSTTTLGLLNPDGTAASWHVIFYSEAANQWVSIDTANGYFTCFANPGKAGRMPDLKPDFFRDGAALYAIAKQNGEALLAQGYSVMIGTAAAPSSNHATWNIQYQKEGARDGGLLVLVDANTGKVEKVLK